MAEQKYRRNIVTALRVPDDVAAERPAELDESETLIRWLDSNVVSGASHMVCIWYHKATPDTVYPQHTHDADEIIGFFGSDDRNPGKLGGEIEFWIEDEQYILDESALIYVPKGVVHCPLVIRRVDTPIFHFTSLVGCGIYQRNDIAAS